VDRGGGAQVVEAPQGHGAVRLELVDAFRQIESSVTSIDPGAEENAQPRVRVCSQPASPSAA
jgi:hypothetical protein